MVSIRSRLRNWWVGLGLGLTVCEMMMGQVAIALDDQAMLLLTNPLTPNEIDFLENGTPPTDSAWVTANTVSQGGLTTPSLWWARQQFGGKLLSNWLAKPATPDLPNHVDLLVNQQVWNTYNYLDRYAFLNQVGTVSKDFGYSTRVFNAQGELLGAYVCNFETLTASTSQTEAQLPAETPCTIFLDPSGPGALRGTATDAWRSIGGGIGR